jgi:hypothetical protein
MRKQRSFWTINLGVRIRLALQKNGEAEENRAFGHRCDDSNLQFSEDSSR